MPSLTVALPHLSPEDFFWRLHFLVGSMAHTMADSERIRLISGGMCDPDDTEGTVQCLVTFLCGGYGQNEMEASHIVACLSAWLLTINAIKHATY